MIDFEEPGDLGVFIDDDQVASLEKKMNRDGYLDGTDMATTFNMLRANDLIWSFVINNYLMGDEPLAFDLLYWNSDSTRMPAKMHSEYLCAMYLENRFKESGGMVLGGVAIDIPSVDTPCYFLSTQEDHIAPWRSTFAGASLLKGPVRFVLSGPGHIAGVVNPPESNKYGYRTHRRRPKGDADAWFESATQKKDPGGRIGSVGVEVLGNESKASNARSEKSFPKPESAPGAFAAKRLDEAESG